MKNKETINLPRLITEVAAGASVDPASARRFLHELFVMIEESLKSGEAIIVKGVGTFTRSEDSEHPVLFQPDEELAAIANEPFAAFSAVELNDGAAEEIMQVETPSPANSEPKESPVTPPQPEPQPEQQNEPEVILSPDPEPDNVTVQTAEQAPIAEIPESNELEVTTREEIKAEVEEPEQKDVKEEKQEAVPAKPVEPTPVMDPVSQPQPKEPVVSPAPQPVIVRQESGNTSMWLVLGLLIGLIIGLVGGYFAGETMAAFKLPGEDEDYEDTLELYMPETVPAAPAQSEDPIQPTAAVPAVETQKAPATDAPKTQTQASTSSTSAKSAPVYDTITRARYLSILAKEHYGSKKYWVFIYNANPQLGDPNKVSPGTRVLIPAKESFMEATPAATDAKAQKLLNELAKKYKL